MGRVKSAGWAVVHKDGAVVAMMRTKKAAKRRLKQEKTNRMDESGLAIVELVYSTGLFEQGESLAT